MQISLSSASIATLEGLATRRWDRGVRVGRTSRKWNSSKKSWLSAWKACFSAYEASTTCPHSVTATNKGRCIAIHLRARGHMGSSKNNRWRCGWSYSMAQMEKQGIAILYPLPYIGPRAKARILASTRILLRSILLESRKWRHIERPSGSPLASSGYRVACAFPCIHDPNQHDSSKL